RVLLAWNGSRESARAAFDALPFLTAAKEVEIFTVDPPENAMQSRDFCGAELAATLARHGIKTTVTSGSSDGHSVADALNRRATEIDAGLIVMGAYSHSRLRQRLFGGMAGPFYAIYLKALALDKRRFRASISSVLLGLGLVRAGGYGSLGFYDRRALALLLALSPIMVVAMLAGDRWHARLDQAKFERVVALLLAASGVALLFK
ncbi:MAG TPA: universal stress protein, partial [Burkholderiales bacterium]|nr:universal stress protein [Burkholderiales bacterium]